MFFIFEIVCLQIWEGITKHVLKALSTSPADVEVLRVYLILPIYHEFVNSKNYPKLHSPFSQAVHTLNKIPLTILSEWWANQSIVYFERFIENYRHVIAHIITYNFPRLNESTLPVIKYERNLELALKMTETLYRINLSKRTQRVPYDSFYLPDLLESIDLRQDYILWMDNQVSLLWAFFFQISLWNNNNLSFYFHLPVKRFLSVQLSVFVRRKSKNIAIANGSGNPNADRNATRATL